MDCPYNLADNRQTRMLADLSLVGCYNVSVMSEEERWAVLLDSAKQNLRSMAFFGLTEYQRKTQYLFERTFNLEFIMPFTQVNGTRASSVEVPPETQLRILQLNRWDVELYEYARDLFLQRFQVARQQERRQARERRQQERRRLRGRFATRQGRMQKPTETPRQPDGHPVGRQSRKTDGDDAESEMLSQDWWDLDKKNATADDYMDNVVQWK